MEYILELTNINKTLNNKSLLENINIQIRKGEVYGLLGVNGARKTTLMKTILNLIQPTTGFIKIFGEGIMTKKVDYLRDIGSIIETPNLYNKLTGRKNLLLHAEYLSYKNQKRIDEVLKLVKLTDVADVLVEKYSLGMKQRLAIAKAILTEPKFLILDEPINGLDPTCIHEIRELLVHLSKKEGVTILISSHILPEIEQIVDTVGIIDKGRLVEELTLNEMHAKSRQYIQIETLDAEKLLTYLVMKLDIKNYKLINNKKINIYDMDVSYHQVIQAISQSDIEVLDVENVQTSLEEYFLNLVNRGEINA